MNLTGASWRRLWTELGAQSIDGGLFNQLVAAYSERHRHYHTLQHLRECLAHCEAAASLALHPAEVELALWFHDAVYDPHQDDNEDAAPSGRGAACSRRAAARMSPSGQASVLATKSHAAAGRDADVQLVLDIDLAILGAAPARFADYGRVRAEYAHVPEADWRAGRTRILAGFLARPRIYATVAFHDALEHRARANIAQALAALQG